LSAGLALSAWLWAVLFFGITHFLLKSYPQASLIKMILAKSPRITLTLDPTPKGVWGHLGSKKVLFCHFLTLALNLTLGSFRVNHEKVIHRQNKSYPQAITLHFSATAGRRHVFH
jgi:hypothetical protein